MKDTLETNLPEEAGKLEETKKPVETPEIDATAAATLFLGMLQPLAILGQLQPQILAEYPPQLWRTYQRSIAP